MRYNVPEWYRDAKFGIMIHWGLYSLPGYASARGQSIADNLREQSWEFHFRNNPYAEWYQNSLRLGAPDTVAFHKRKYNPRYRYEQLADRFNDEIQKWDPAEWADLFAECGAKYVIPVSKHHDGFLLWKSKHPPVIDGYVASRDVIAELAEAVRERGLKFGLYYSGKLDWTYQEDPISDLVDLLTVPQDAEYTRYVVSHFDELISRFEPDVLWNDIGLPAGFPRRRLFENYGRAVPEGVLNDRWTQVSAPARKIMKIPAVRRATNNRGRRMFAAGGMRPVAGGVWTVEYGPSVALQKSPWEAVRSVGNSFGWNENEPDESYLDGEALMKMLVDTVSKNGNLLLNLGPKADGTIPPEQRVPLLDLAAWLRTNGGAIYGTRPWHRAEGETSEGQPVRFTATDRNLYAILLDRPRRLSVEIPGIDQGRLPRPAGESRKNGELRVSILGCEYPIQWRLHDGTLEVRLPGGFVPAGPVVISLSWHAENPQPPTIQMYTDVIG